MQNLDRLYAVSSDRSATFFPVAYELTEFAAASQLRILEEVALKSSSKMDRISEGEVRTGCATSAILNPSAGWPLLSFYSFFERLDARYPYQGP